MLPQSSEVAANRALDLTKRWPNLEISTQHDFVRSVGRRVVVGQTAAWIELDRERLAKALLGEKSQSFPTIGYQGPKQSGCVLTLDPLAEDVKFTSSDRITLVPRRFLFLVW